MAEKAEDRPFQLAATIHPAMMTWIQTCMHLDNVFGVSPLNMTAGIFLEEDSREERTRRTRAPAVWNSRMALHRRDRHGIRRLGRKGVGVQRNVLSRMPDRRDKPSVISDRAQRQVHGETSATALSSSWKCRPPREDRRPTTQTSNRTQERGSRCTASSSSHQGGYQDGQRATDERQRKMEPSAHRMTTEAQGLYEEEKRTGLPIKDGSRW